MGGKMHLSQQNNFATKSAKNPDNLISFVREINTHLLRMYI